MKYEILVEDVIDSLDAALFTGDLFLNSENREDLRNWMARWEGQLKEYDEIDSEIPVHPKFNVGDVVEVYRKFDKFDVGWITTMDEFIGKEYTIIRVDRDNSVLLEGCEGWWIPLESLLLVTKSGE